MLELRRCSLDYFVPGIKKRKIPVFRDMDLVGNRGEITAILGPSGCGKTSLIHALAGLVAPTEGSIHIDDQALQGIRARSTVIFQDFGLLPWSTALANVGLPLALQGVSRLERKKRALAILKEFGLDAFASAYPHQLSGGMKQRLAIARALIGDPDLLLMDEPFSSLDALSREAAQDFLLKIQRGRAMTMVLVTHSIEEAVYLSGRVYIMKGRNPGYMTDYIDIPSQVREAKSTDRGSFRDSSEFFVLCKHVRELLHDA